MLIDTFSTIRRSIIAFAIANKHASVMTPQVVGLLHAGFNGTNITLAVPSWLVAEAFENYRRSVPLDFDGVPRFEDAAASLGESLGLGRMPNKSLDRSAESVFRSLID